MVVSKKKDTFKTVTFLFALVTFYSSAQTSFFKSNITINNYQPDNLISSFTIDENQVYFNTSNYTLYVIDKNNLQLKFETPLRYKSNNPPYILNDKIVVGTFIDKIKNTLLLNKSTGIIEQTLNLAPSITIPYQINNILYGTTITDNGGEFFAFDLQNNKILWEKFIAHGISRQPIYRQNYITLSIGDDNWTNVNYDGTLKDTLCDSKFYLDTEEAFCVSNYNYLTHDNLELTGDILENKFQFYIGFDGSYVKTKNNKSNTVLLNDQMLLVLKGGKKLKVKFDLLEKINLPDEGENEYLEILELNDNSVWFLYENVVVHYDFKLNKIIKTYDVSQWNPHQAKLDGNNLWLISKNDGQLYGLQLEETKESIDRKAEIVRKQKEMGCVEPDQKRIAAEKKAKEEMDNKIQKNKL
jgi:hypothetical protein